MNACKGTGLVRRTTKRCSLARHRIAPTSWMWMKTGLRSCSTPAARPLSPKALLTHRNIYLHAFNAALAHHPGEDAVELHTIPLFHANGWGVAHFLTLLGGTHVNEKSAQ